MISERPIRPQADAPLAQSLADLPPFLFERLMTESHAVKLDARDPLFHAGDAADGCYIVRSGALKAVIVAADGTERMLAAFGPGKMLGEMALFDSKPRSASVVAIKPSVLAFLPKDAFFRFADANPRIYRQMLTVLVARLRGSNEGILAQTSGSVSERVARAMLTLAETFGEGDATRRRRIGQRVTQSDVAAMAGVARENASRVINRWMRNGVLSRARGHYVIENVNALLREIDGA